MLFGYIEQNERKITMGELIKRLREANLSMDNTVLFLKNLSMDDQIITRIISGLG